ncbi:hypothetical protein [Lysobacter sp. FW306-1B-D06B]|uniref:hypothetical protein n=1 Tax=Lysobacter sp. FW306-1B-D06B TaxID=3140250 RepID=UPI00314095D8
MTGTYTSSYTRTHTATYVADKMRGLLSELVRDYGLDPKALHDSWSGPVGNAARAWMESGHLTVITIEFYPVGSNTAVARWDFPIRYDAAGVEELWVDKAFLRDTVAKAKAPPSGCIYRVLLSRRSGAPAVHGIVDCEFKDVSALLARDAGTVISTPDINASARYYR